MNLCHLTINIIDYERRIFNQIHSANKAGYRVQVFASGRPGEIKKEEKAGFSLYRIKTIFHKGGPFKFISINLQLFFLLYARKYELIHCHDVWVLPAAAGVSWLKKIPLIYDAHEYYAGLEIFRKKPISRYLWLLAERISIRQVKALLTVSEPLGERFRKRYPGLTQIEIIRNLPRYEQVDPNAAPLMTRMENTVLILYQGHFKPGRGLENLIRAVGKIPAVKLILIGSGEIQDRLTRLVEMENVTDRVFFKGFIPTEQLISVTAQGDIGAVLFEPSSLNYAAALPNKFFEYIMAGVPVLCSDIETLSWYVEHYDLGLTVDPADIQAIRKTIEKMISDRNRLKQWKENALRAALELNWENEEKKLIQIYERFEP
jgi:glycosyltransferase involved in cell wall biosynthesis